MKLSRRTLLNNAAAASLVTALPLTGCRDSSVTQEDTSPAPVVSNDIEGSATALLKKATDFMLKAYPESASSAGIDRANMQG